MKKRLCFILSLFFLPVQAMEQPKSDIFKACFDGDLARVQELIRSGVSVNNKFPRAAAYGLNLQPGRADMTPLMLAAHRGHLLIVFELIKAGANIQERGDFCNLVSLDAFCYSILSKNFDVAEVLLQAGAKIDRSVNSSTYTHLLARFFDRPYGQMTLLEYLCRFEKIQRSREIDFLVASGASIEKAFCDITYKNTKHNLRNVICSSFAVSPYSNAISSAQKIKELLLCFHRVHVPRDMRHLILLEAAPKELISVLAKRVAGKKPIPLFALGVMTDACYRATAEALIPKLEEAYTCYLPVCLASKNAGMPLYQNVDAAIGPFLDPANFEDNYGEELRANIRARLANPYWYKRKLLGLEHKSDTDSLRSHAESLS